MGSAVTIRLIKKIRSFLGPFDQLGHFATPINAIRIYEPIPSGNLIQLDKLRNAVSRLLEYYFNLTGRMHVDPNTGVRSMTRIGPGTQLVEAYCNTERRWMSRRRYGVRKD